MALLGTTTLTVSLNNIKLFCTTCDGREVFTPLYGIDVRSQLSGPVKDPLTTMTQLFNLAYQCQRCFAAPYGFIVRRQGWHMFLDGRSPMEHLEVPNYIPKPERPLFRDALIAIHGGKVLGALFYLRTFIEQFARRQTGITTRITGDDIMAAYSKQLPAAQRDYMPSLGEWYSQLSEAVHAAREDEDLFERARVEIEKHFDIRRVFNIPEMTK